MEIQLKDIRVDKAYSMVPGKDVIRISILITGENNEENMFHITMKESLTGDILANTLEALAIKIRKDYSS